MRSVFFLGVFSIGAFAQPGPPPGSPAQLPPATVQSTVQSTAQPTVAPPATAVVPSAGLAKPQQATPLTQAQASDPGYSFNPLAVKRDPFTPPENLPGRSLNELERYDLNQMSLVAILQGLGQPQAMLVLPSGKTHIIQVGDVVGKRSGKVSKITRNEVVVKETFKDFQNRVKTDLTSLMIAE